MKYREVNNSEDILYFRDIVERIEELEDELSVMQDLEDEIESLDEEEDKEEIRIAKEELEKKEKEFEPEIEELKILKEFISEFAGYGGDEKYEGESYPSTFISDNHWEEFVKSECEDFGYIPKDLPWWIFIDWEKTSERYQEGYISGDFDGERYWALCN